MTKHCELCGETPCAYEHISEQISDYNRGWEDCEKAMIEWLNGGLMEHKQLARRIAKGELRKGHNDE